MLKRWADIATVSCLIVCAIIEAGQQALKDAPTVAALLPSFISGRSWNYVPLFFLIVAGVSWTVGRLSPSRDSRVISGDTGTSKASKLVIHSAVYGAGDATDVSVAHKLNTATRDALAIPVNNNLISGDPDPAPNQPKRLKVTYSYGEMNPATILVPEYSWLILPQDPQIQRLASEVERLKNQPKPPSVEILSPNNLSLTPLQKDALQLSVDLLKFLKRLGPPPAPKYTGEDINNMTSAQMKKLIEAEDGDFAEACEYYQGDGTLFVHTANAYSNKITAQWKRLLPWYQKLAASYALEFKDKVETMRNRFLLEGMTGDEVLLMPVEGKYGEQRVRNLAAKLWELAYKTGEKGIA